MLAQLALLVHWLYGIPLIKAQHALIRDENSSVSLATKAINKVTQSARELATAGKRLDGLRHARYLEKLGLSYSEIVKGMVI